MTFLVISSFNKFHFRKEYDAMSVKAVLTDLILKRVKFVFATIQIIRDTHPAILKLLQSVSQTDKAR